MKHPILNFFLLVLGVLFNSILDSVHQNAEVTKTLPKENLNSTLNKRALAAWFQCLCWWKEDKAVTVQLKPVAMTICIKVIVKLLRGLFGDLPFKSN